MSPTFPIADECLNILELDTSEHLSSFTVLIHFETRAFNTINSRVEIVSAVSVQQVVITVITVCIVEFL